MKNLMVFCSVLTAVAVGGMVVAAEPADKGESKPSAEEIRIAVQGICPVSGEKLGAHGKPVQVKIGEEHVFLCCKACMSGKVKPELWATIHTNLAKSQGICPVMKNELPKGAKWTIVEGRIIYVCCPPCIKKIEADPKTYIKAVDELYRESVEKKKESENKKEGAKE